MACREREDAPHPTTRAHRVLPCPAGRGGRAAPPGVVAALDGLQLQRVLELAARAGGGLVEDAEAEGELRLLGERDAGRRRRKEMERGRGRGKRRRWE